VTDSAGDEPGTDPGSAPPAEVGSAVWQHAPAAAYVESPPGTAERVVVVDLDHLDLPPYVFEGSAAQVWMCLDGDRSETEIVADLAEAYDVPLEVVTPDVRLFVDRLRDLGLIALGTAADA
jgi:hypothetical protein